MLPVPLNSSKMTSSILLCIYQRRSDDGKRAALFDFTGRAKEGLWLLQRIGIEPTA